MIRFYPASIFQWGTLGIVADKETQTGGSAICFGPSGTHMNSVSINCKELKTAEKCCQFVVLRFRYSQGVREKILMIDDAVKTIEMYGSKKDSLDEEPYYILNWNTLEGNVETELPFG